MRLHRGLQGLSAELPASTELPRPAGGAAQLGPLLPAPYDHLHGGRGAALHSRRLRTHAERLRGQRPAGVHPPHQPDHGQVQGTESVSKEVLKPVKEVCENCFSCCYGSGRCLPSCSRSSCRWCSPSSRCWRGRRRTTTRRLLWRSRCCAGATSASSRPSQEAGWTRWWPIRVSDWFVDLWRLSLFWSVGFTLFITPGAENIERVVFTIIQGAVDFPDPIAQKTCFIILSKLVELWGESMRRNGERWLLLSCSCFSAVFSRRSDLLCRRKGRHGGLPGLHLQTHRPCVFPGSSQTDLWPLRRSDGPGEFLSDSVLDACDLEFLTFRTTVCFADAVGVRRHAEDDSPQTGKRGFTVPRRQMFCFHLSGLL